MKNKFREQFEEHEYLYHYTTVESLLFILVNRVLKFNKVNNFNDISESVRNEHVKFFASCLTYSAEESIPMWLIYANKENGIRIGFPNVEVFTQKSYFYFDEGNKKLVNLNEVGGILYGQIEYDDSLASKSPSQGDDGIRMTHVYNMACQKRKVWSYEEELRYFIVDDLNLIKDAKCLYVDLNDTFFNDLIITFNPFMAEYKKNEIKEAVKNLDLYNVRFEESSLRGTIK
ncbi:MAG: DUF2971 domain-containing protein [Tissierellales bacterium]|nr:DUF2971 domain-containing protein [Tissierellales bacterium]